MNDLPFVSAVVPCRNEEKHIRVCLDSIAANSYPKDRMEVIVVDGRSSDRTKAILRDLTQQYPFIRTMDNPKQTIPAAMNIGVLKARGQVILKLDAHSTYPPDYISNCVQYMGEYQADDVGGILRIIPGNETTLASVIPQVLSHPFGSGNACVKVGSKELCWADTAAFGCYRKDVFEKVGLWNEELAGSSDMDFNIRLKKAGGKILLVPGIQINYFADSNLRSFWLHNFADGVWATYVMKFGSEAWAWRHWVPLAFVSSLIALATLAFFLPTLWWAFFAIAGAYAMANLAASAQISVRERKPEYLPTLPLAFAVRHIAHGLGALLGLLLVLVPGKHWEGRQRAKC